MKVSSLITKISPGAGVSYEAESIYVLCGFACIKRGLPISKPQPTLLDIYHVFTSKKHEVLETSLDRNRLDRRLWIHWHRNYKMECEAQYNTTSQLKKYNLEPISA